MNEEENKNILDLVEINKILSDVLMKVSERKISLKRAQVISRVSLALSKSITNIDLKKRIEFLEQVLKDRK